MSYKINLRAGSVEFRWSQGNESYELIEWFPHDEKECCIVICFFEEGKEGWSMKTVGERYLNALMSECENTIIVSKYAMDFLGAKFEAEERIKEQ